MYSFGRYNSCVMTQEPGPVRAPEFPTGVTWLQGGPLRLADLRGRPVLIDFWDYTCVNCLRTLPYLKEWHRRYASLGLTIVGVHAPEFSFAHNGEHVRRAVAERGLAYPIALDNDYAIWQAYANRYWPAKYLIDREGYFFLEGDWLLTAESAARPVGASGESRLHVRYMAKEVNLVMMPPLAGGDARLEVLHSGSPLAAEDAGDDVRVEDGKAVVVVNTPRMYRLVNNRQIDTHELTLVTTSDGLALYAFTFVSCLAEQT